jgi:phage terminase small subunit
MSKGRTKHAPRKGAHGSEGRTLSIRQRAFLREKILGSNDKEAALAAGYSPSVAENTKQKIWAKPIVLIEFKR